MGLHKVVDLGMWWQDTTGLPLPLGANAIRRSLGAEFGPQVARIIRESVSYALDHREPALDYALQFARDMDPLLADKFIGMYVNQWTLDYGEEGRRAVRELLRARRRRRVFVPCCLVQGLAFHSERRRSGSEQRNEREEFSLLACGHGR